MIARASTMLILAAALACDAAAQDVELDSDGEETTDAYADDETRLAEIACDEAPVLTYDTFGRGFLATYCNGCHGGEVVDRKGAPPTVVFDDVDAASLFAERILVRVSPSDGLPPMPPAGGITKDDLERARIWLTCYP